jgi:hypothetical protein
MATSIRHELSRMRIQSVSICETMTKQKSFAPILPGQNGKPETQCPGHPVRRRADGKMKMVCQSRLHVISVPDRS